MTRGAWIAMGTFVVLLALVLIFAMKPTGQSQPELSLQGWQKGAAKIDKPEQDGPIDRITIKFKGHTLTAQRDKKNTKIWLLDQPKGARAAIYNLRKVLKLFRGPISSNISSKLSKQDLQAFGFDPNNIIRVTLYKAGKKFVDLELGSVQKTKTGKESSSDTWVRIAGQDRAFRILGKDMRRPFGKDLARFRNRKVFVFDKKDIAKVEILNPLAKEEKDRHIVLKSELKTTKKDAKKTEKSKTWHIIIPKGYKTGDPGVYLGLIANLYAQKFLKKLPNGIKINKKKAFQLRVTLDDGTTKIIWISGKYIQKEGAAEFIEASDYAAKSLRAGLNEFRDKHVWTAPRETIKKVEILTDRGRFVMRLNGNTWKAIAPTRFVLDENKRDRFLKDIEGLTANTFEKPSPQALRKADFAHPYTTCRLELSDGRKPELVIGALKKRGERYARVTGQKDLIILSDYVANKLHNAIKRLEKKEGKKKGR